MKPPTRLLLPFASLLVVCAMFSCERMPDQNRQQYVQDSLAVVARQDSIARDSVERARKLAHEKAYSKDVNVALRHDAQLARTMPLERFSKHMQSRKNYYRQFEKVSYEDEFVKIKMEGDEMKIETPHGKAKFDEDETKIKTDTYKRKTERK